MPKFSNTKRIYIENITESIINLNEEQLHYINYVLRMRCGDQIRVFNKEDGEFLTKLIKTNVTGLQIIEKIREKEMKPCTVFLGQGLIKSDKMASSFVMATELGVDILQPVICARSQFNSFNINRFKKCIMESAEQSERLDIPEIFDPISMENFLKLDIDLFIVCDEEQKDIVKIDTVDFRDKKSIGILVGPEGGFSDSERSLMNKHNVIKISLHQNILRAETATAAILAQISLKI